MIKTITLFLLLLVISFSASADFWDEEEDDFQPITKRNTVEVSENIPKSTLPARRNTPPTNRRFINKTKVVAKKKVPSKPMALPIDKTVRLRPSANNPTINKNLRLSLQSNYMKEVDRWYNAGGDVNAKDLSGRTMLYLAIQRHHLIGIEYLLQRRANVRLSNEDGGTPLGIAVKTGQSKVVQYLLERGASVAPLPGGENMAHYAISRGYNQIAIDLIGKGINVNKVYADNETLLHIATRKGLSRVTQALLAAGANPNARNSEGATPLHVAAALGREQIVNQLLASKADPKVQTSKRWQPIHHAARFGHSSIVRTLVSRYGSSVNNRTSGGKTPLDLAQQLGHENIIDYLLPRTSGGRRVVRTASGTIKPTKRTGWFW